MDSLTHLDEKGNAHMVDVGEKPDTKRKAVAAGVIYVGEKVGDAISGGCVPKGDVFSAARIAGIMAAKKTWELIPLCHPLAITSVNVDFDMKKDGNGYAIECECTACVTGKTGVEMEALTGASVALLTIYDMCKALDKSMVIGEIRLLEKEGGKSGIYKSEN